jgi:pyruvate dehydrogenase E2 component (dihydrolipoyllysine-residue acetyltransferase)
VTSTEQQAGRLVDVTMPRLSDSMEEGTILQWLKRPGDAVAKGEPLVEVETDKATIVYEAERDGVLAEITVDENGTAALGAVIARLQVADGTAAPAVKPAAAPSAATQEATADAPPSVATASPGGPRARATPVARRLAIELDVPLEGLSGSGVGGRIVRADVRRAAEQGVRRPVPKPTALEAVDVPLTATQRTIAQRMALSRREIPDFTVEAEIDMEAASALRGDLRALGHDPLPSLNDLIVRAAALALREFPGLNAAFIDDHVVRFERVNVGIAVATEDSLIVPTIFDADRKSLREIAVAARELTEKVRRRSIAPNDLRGGSFTISNLGMFGVRRFNAVINPPQAAILAVGEVSPRAVVADDGQIVGRRRMDVALSCDHRVVYGAEAARFLQRLRTLLERPISLVLDPKEA